jgi:uncharacterized protein (TIGR03118 family)
MVMSAGGSCVRDCGRGIRRHAVLSAGLIVGIWSFAADAGFIETDLVSDGAVPAATIDPQLVNPWGITYPTGGGPFWINENGSGTAALFNGAGQPFPIGNPLVVTVPPPMSMPGTTSAPTGVVFNTSSTGFNVSSNGVSGSSRFLFATEDGTISGWNPTVNATNAVVAVDRSSTGAVYKGLTIANNNLYAANFRSGQIEQFDQTFKPVRSFTGPSLPPGFAPFGIQNLNGNLFVTYALQAPGAHDDQAGPGNGFVDEFDGNGNFMRRIAANGPLNSPWGLAIAPASFGTFAGALLVGDFGDGHINAYNLDTLQLIGQLTDANGNALTIDGLWGLIPGNGGNGGDPNDIFFTAGINGESDGLVGSLSPIPEPGSMAAVLTGLAGLLLIRLRRRRGEAGSSTCI